MLISLAVQYATSLKETIRTVIIGAEKVIPEGSEYPDMSLSSLVADTIMVCSNTNSCTSGNEECFFMQELHGKEKNNSINEGIYEYNLRHNQQI